MLYSNEHGDILMIREVADYLHISERTVYRWLAKGLLPAIRVGNVTRIRREDLDAFIEANTNTITKGQRGQSFIVMLLVILPLLLFVLGIAYDLGNAAAGVTIAQNAADLAAQEAGKVVDVDHFIAWQEVRLRPEATLVAQQMADDLTGGAFVVDQVYAEGRIVVVEGRVAVRTPFLHTFMGIERLVRPVQGVAETAHGAERGGE